MPTLAHQRPFARRLVVVQRFAAADRTPSEFAALWTTETSNASEERFALTTLNTASGNSRQGFAPPANAALDTTSQRLTHEPLRRRSAQPNRKRNQSHSIESLL